MLSPESRQYRRLLHESQRIEAVATMVYRVLGQRSRDQPLRAVMLQLAADEETHAAAVARLLHQHRWSNDPWRGLASTLGWLTGIGLSWCRVEVTLRTLIQFEENGAETYRHMLELDSLLQNERNEILEIAETEEKHVVLLGSALEEK